MADTGPVDYGVPMRRCGVRHFGLCLTEEPNGLPPGRIPAARCAQIEPPPFPFANENTEEPVNNRARCLETALEYTQKDRNQAHGNPENNFENIARFWNAHLIARYGDRVVVPELDATDVAIMMAGMKMARLSHNPGHEDSWIDLAGYAACGMEIALKNLPESA